jgi:signal transduction histidine kinase
MTELRPPILDERGLEAALVDYCLDFQERTGVACSVSAELPARLEPAQETILYRLAQEALINTGKHAGAGRATILLRFSEASVVLTVHDDGVGFDVASARDPAGRDHFGLAVMRERVEMAGGRWEVRSSPGQGTRIMASLPLQAAPTTHREEVPV